MAMAIPALIPLLTGSAAATGLTAASTGLAVASGVVGTVAAVGDARYRSQVATNNATIAEANRVRTLEETGIRAQEQDMSARADIGAMLARQGASGLSMGIGSMALRRKSAGELAAKDRSRLVYTGQTEANQFEQQAQDFREESRMAKRESRFALVGGALGIGSSLIGGATKINSQKASSLRSA